MFSKYFYKCYAGYLPFGEGHEQGVNNGEHSSPADHSGALLVLQNKLLFHVVSVYGIESVILSDILAALLDSRNEKNTNVITA